MIKIPENIKVSLIKNMQSPQGTCDFTITFEKSIFNKDNNKDEILFENISGAHYFMLMRASDLKIKFYHSSPSTGTRLCVVDISKSISSLKVKFCFTWSQKELGLYVGPVGVVGGVLEIGKEIPSDKYFKVTKNGQVIEVVGPDMEVMGLRISQNGENILEDTAIESWNETSKAIDVLSKATSVDGYIFEVVKSNFISVNLVTGIETYCKRRLQELELEGIQLNYENLEKKTRLTKSKIFAKTSSYFQDLDSMKKIWEYLVGIKVSEIEPTAWLSFKEKLYPHRHVVIHSHPLRPMIETLNKKNPIFITNEINILKNNSVNFIEKLHRQTIDLK